MTTKFSMQSMRAVSIRNAIIVGAACILTFFLGKDINWDLINYHYYLAYAWENDKFKVDFFGAGPTSYLSPLPYLPFYWMTKAGWHSLSIGLILGAVHAANLILLWELCEKVLFKREQFFFQYTLMSVSLAASAPVFLGLLGGTFLEPLLTILVFTGLLLTAISFNESNLRYRMLLILAAAMLLGAATGLKLTNIVFAAALGLSLVLTAGVNRRAVVLGAVFGGGLVIGWLLVNGWHAWNLYSEFGNPFFPFFNEIFRSPDFSTAKLDHDRFKPHSISELLAYPFRMAQFQSWIYIERLAPDIRPALAVLAGLALLLKHVYSRIRASTSTKPVAADADLDKVNSSRLVYIFVGISTLLWLWTTGNGRYGLPVLMLLGPVIVVIGIRLVSNVKILAYMTAGVLLVQVIQIVFAWSPRWDSAPWTTAWFDADVPPVLSQRPWAYLSLGSAHSNAIAAPFLHKGSAFASISGNTYTFSPEGPGSMRFKQFIAQHQGNLRMLVRAHTVRKSINEAEFSLFDQPLLPWKLRIDRGDCAFITINLESEKQHSNSAQLLTSNPGAQPIDVHLISCALLPGPGEDVATLAERKRLTVVFDKLERSCPMLFSPAGWYLSKNQSGWNRRYLQSDVVVYARKGRLSASRYDFGPYDIDLGSIEQWERGETPFDCKRLPRPW